MDPDDEAFNWTRFLRHDSPLDRLRRDPTRALVVGSSSSRIIPIPSHSGRPTTLLPSRLLAMPMRATIDYTSESRAPFKFKPLILSQVLSNRPKKPLLKPLLLPGTISARSNGPLLSIEENDSYNAALGPRGHLPSMAPFTPVLAGPLPPLPTVEDSQLPSPEPVASGSTTPTSSTSSPPLPTPPMELSGSTSRRRTTAARSQMSAYDPMTIFEAWKQELDLEDDDVS